MARKDGDLSGFIVDNMDEAVQAVRQLGELDRQRSHAARREGPGQILEDVLADHPADTHGLGAIRTACQEYIRGPLREQMEANLRRALDAAKLPANRGRVELDPDDADGQSLLLWYPTVTAAGNDYIRVALTATDERVDAAAERLRALAAR